jgi:hypothetical protein
MSTGECQYEGWKGPDDSSDDSPPCMDDYDSSDKENCKVDLEVENDSIKKKYANFELSTFLSMEKIIGIDKLVMFLQRQLDTELIMSEKTVPKVQAAVLPFLSFCNFDVLEELIELYGTDNDKENLKEYLGAFDKSIVVLKHNRVRLSHAMKDRDLICIKLGIDVDKLQYDMVRRVKQRISRIIKVNRSKLQLRSIEEGCIELDFLVPASVSESAVDLRKKSRAFKQELFKESITFMQVYRVSLCTGCRALPRELFHVYLCN